MNRSSSPIVSLLVFVFMVTCLIFNIQFSHPVGAGVSDVSQRLPINLIVDPLLYSQLAKLTASDAAADDFFGYTVSLSGDTALVGAHRDDDGGDSSGSAYIFERDQGGADSWGQVTKLTTSNAAASDHFGIAVSLSGDTALVGSYGDFFYSGSAYIFERNQGGANNWGQVAKLTASDAAGSDYFGHAVSLSGDIALVGAYGDQDGGVLSGSAYIFERNHDGSNNWGQVAKLTASDADADDRFGLAVSLSGDTALVGAQWNDDGGDYSGSAYIFERSQGGANNWGQVVKLIASDTELADLFGSAVSLSGDTALVGAYGDDDNRGSAYIFERNQGGANNWGQVAKLMASDGAAIDGFGINVAISGDTAVVGACCDDDNGTDSGSAYIYVRDGNGNWSQQAKLTASDGAADDSFGRAVSLSGDMALVGARGDDDGGNSSGSAYIFNFVEMSFTIYLPFVTKP